MAQLLMYFCGVEINIVTTGINNAFATNETFVATKNS